MSERMRKILESKRALRQQHAALPFAEKLVLLEKLRERSVAIAASPLRHRVVK
ncbi:MAG TPA: hypothetical protein VGI63_09895 [Verrucomicrobiae bacterium]|jgi:hypothetical protein